MSQNKKHAENDLDHSFDSSGSLPVSDAHLQAAVMIKGLGKTEITLTESRTPGIQMNWTRDGLWIEIKNKKSFIPATNIKIVNFK